MNPRLFSFNAPFGACPECKGIGKNLEVDENKLIDNDELSIVEGGMYIPGAMARKGYSWEIFKAMAKHLKIDINKPIKDLSKRDMEIIFHGSDTKFKFDYEGDDFQFHGYKQYEGAVKNLERRYHETFSDAMKEEIENKYMVERICKVCNGKRLKPEVLSVTVGDKNIMEICELSIKDSLKFFLDLKLTNKQELIAKEILKEIRERLSFMINVGLDYLNLARETKTLSGGEAQRIRLATQIGSGLTGVLYVLDEPSIGLHQKDNDKLLATLGRLKDLGNTLIVVEHDEDTMLQADEILDLGPGAGDFGGEIVAYGSPKEIMENEELMIMSYPKSLLCIVGGAAAIAFGGDLTVDAASRIAIDFGMSQNLVGLTIVSIGTSLPELVTSIVAARKNEVDMAVGNAIGSNIFNILMVLGIASAISPLQLIGENVIDIIVLVVFSVVVWIFGATKKKISRTEGIAMICMYLCYSVYIIMR